VAVPEEFIDSGPDIPAYINSFKSCTLKFLVVVLLESVPINFIF